MRQLAQLTVTACCRIALQGVNRAPDVAHNLRVGRRFFQVETFLVQRLQQLLRAFKEDGAQFVGPLFGEKAHAVPSIRL